MNVCPALFRATCSAWASEIEPVSFFGSSFDLTAQLATEIDRAAQQSAQVVDRGIGGLQVVPRGFDNIGETLALFTRFAHEFENQEINKTQGPQPLKIRGTWPGCLF